MPTIPCATAITLTAEERAVLEALVRSTKSEIRMRLRARIVLFAADGTSTREIGRIVGCTTGTASKWRVRYAASRLAGLDETGNRGAEPKYGPAEQKRILARCEAGGHVRGKTPLHSLLPDVVASVHVPVLAAGGIVSGADVATALALGAQGAVIGTALVATDESFAHAYHKERLVIAREGDTVLTDAFHINWPAGAKVRVLANSVTQGKHGDPFTSARIEIGNEEGRPIYLFSTDSPLRSMTGDFEAMALYAGTGVGRISKITTTTERLGGIISDAIARVDVCVEHPDESPVFASSACSAHEMDDVYMGFAGREELLVSLNELLEAERAGVRVALRAVTEIEDPSLKMLITGIHRDEVRWCGVLTGAILSLKGTPSTQTGEFYERAMAIADLPQRLAFLNKGQAWVVRKLRTLLPKIRSERIHGDIMAILVSHEENIEHIASHFAPAGDQPPASP
jgi:nitronate monooxygenase